jgi:hypothetical protein
MSRSDPGRALLSITYLGPVQYFTKFLLHTETIIEQYDHYIKQTYRNRCHIMGANGMLPLSIPVLKGEAHKTYVRDIRIDNQKKWQKLHWRSIVSAYRHSPFFEFYVDELSPFFEQTYAFLMDYDVALLEWILRSLEMDINLSYSMAFTDTAGEHSADYREVIHPKRDLSSDPFFVPVAYPQVFADRHGFRANLSIIDLLFNEGPNARSVLEQCIAHPY